MFQYDKPKNDCYQRFFYNKSGSIKDNKLIKGFKLIKTIHNMPNQ